RFSARYLAKAHKFGGCLPAGVNNFTGPSIRRRNQTVPYKTKDLWPKSARCVTARRVLRRISFVLDGGSAVPELVPADAEIVAQQAAEGGDGQPDDGARVAVDAADECLPAAVDGERSGDTEGFVRRDV